MRRYLVELALGIIVALWAFHVLSVLFNNFPAGTP